MTTMKIRQMSARSLRRLLPILALILTACGGDDPVDPGPGGDPSADLAATATGPAAAAVGADADFQLTVANAGPSSAEAVVLEAELPPGVTAAAISGSGTQSGSTVSWAVGTLASGASESRSITLNIEEEGSFEVVVSASSDTDDPDASNNDGSAPGAVAEVDVMVSADVVTTLSGDAAAATGDAVEWQVTVRNAGPSPATDVVVTLDLDRDVAALAASDDGVVDGSTVTWPSIDALGDDESVQFTVTAEAPEIGPLEATVSATASSNDATPGNNDGSAGASKSRLLVTFDRVYTVTGESDGDQFGWLMDEIGDIDGDDASDIVVGAPFSDAGGNDAGRAYVYSGATGDLIHRFTGSAGQLMGFAVDAAGDVDGDGVPDVVIGGWGGAGRVVVISGADGSTIHDISGENAGDAFGRAVGRLGDVNSDGFDDFLATAPGSDVGADDSGRVYVIDGATGTVLAAMSPTTSGGLFGSAVGGLGDLTGDGIPDFGVGSSQAPGGGLLFVLSGADATPVFPTVEAPGGAGTFAAFWLDTPGDVNGDGLNDIYVSDINDASAGSQAGRAFVLSGADGSILVDILGETAGDQFGMGRPTEDANGDGIADLFLAAWQNDQGASGAGKAYVYSGADGSLLRSFVSRTAGENLGFDAIAVGDVTGDEVPDYVISGGISPTSPGRFHLVAGVPVD